MSDLTCNGVPVVSAKITRPRIGSWFAELVVDTDAPMTGAAVLADGDGAVLFRGTIQRGAPAQGRLELRIIGGAGGLGATVEPRYYLAAPPRVVLRDLARETGETLATLDAPAIDASLRAWTRERGEAARALRQLAEALGLTWRGLPDGTQWVGAETWPDCAAQGYEVLHEEPAHARWTLSTVTLTAAVAIAPGTTLEGLRVSLVEHAISAESTRTVVSFERPDATLDRLRDTISRTIQRETARLSYACMYPARVVEQLGDGMLGVILDDARFPPMTGVPLRLSIPGSVRVPAGARVLVGFEEGSPAKPYASLFEGSGLTRADLGAGGPAVARVGDAVGLQMRVAVDGGGKVTAVYTRASATAPEVTLTSSYLDVSGQVTSGSAKVFAE